MWKIFYHGTSSANLDSIKAHGLEPGMARGGDAWASAMLPLVAMGSKMREPSVYVTVDRDIAKRFSIIASQVSGGDPIILRIKVPVEVADTFVRDELWSDDDEVQNIAWRAASIAPKYITFPMHGSSRSTQAEE